MRRNHKKLCPLAFRIEIKMSASPIHIGFGNTDTFTIEDVQKYNKWRKT